jgi:hypothetical protein
MPTILCHIQNEDPVMGESDELPSAQDNFIILKNPRRRDGKDLTALDTNVVTIIYPIHRINYIEVLPIGEEEEIIGFVRE